MAPKKKEKAHSFPAELYVRFEKDDYGDGGYYTADTTFQEANDGERIAFYVLSEVVIKRVTHDIERVEE